MKYIWRRILGLTGKLRSSSFLSTCVRTKTAASGSPVKPKQPLVLKLRPTTLVRGAYTNKGFGYEIEKLYVSFTPRPTRMAVATHRGAPSFGLRLPPGDYLMAIGGVDCRRMSPSITVTGDIPVLDMGTTDLKPTIIAQYYGRAPPAWHVTEARGVKAETTLADFKGKWVLLEFWGFW